MTIKNIAPVKIVRKTVKTLEVGQTLQIILSERILGGADHFGGESVSSTFIVSSISANGGVELVQDGGKGHSVWLPQKALVSKEMYAPRGVVLAPEAQFVSAKLAQWFTLSLRQEEAVCGHSVRRVDIVQPSTNRAVVEMWQYGKMVSQEVTIKEAK